MMTRHRLLPVLALAAAACAHAPPSPSNPPEACKDEASRLCATNSFFMRSTETGQIVGCLQAQADSLSAACRLAVMTPQQVAANPQEANADFTKACTPDAAQLCPGVQPEGSKLLNCLRVQSLSLAEPCQIAVASALELNSQFKAACSTEATRLCPGIQPGEGRVIACLKSRASQLDIACSRLILP
jgi:hypothetical protein